MHSDTGSVYRSRRWLSRLLLEDGVRKSYSENGCKTGSWIESTWPRIKVERRDQVAELKELTGLRTFFADYIPHYNRKRRHSGIKNQPPFDYLADALTGITTGRAVSRN